MVKKLIEGFLKRKLEAKLEAKDGKDKGASDDVPDELPPLGEDSAQPAAAAAPEAAKGDAEPPEELPSLEEKHPEVVDVRPAPRKEQEGQSEDAFEQPEENEVDGGADASAKDDERQKELQQPLAAAGSEGFFASLSRLLKSGKPVEPLISHDLLANMKESWGIRKEASQTGMSSTDEKRVSTAISETLAQLRLMESKWKAHRMMLDEYEKLTKEQEDKMRVKEKELKALLKRQKLYQQAPEDAVIMLKGTIPIRCVSELVNALRTMDNSTFSTFVNSRRNDFSRLASAIDKRLGEDLKKASTKEGMLKILDRFVKRLSE